MKLPKNDAYLQKTRKSNSKLWFMLPSWKQQAKNINRHVQLCQHLIPFESFCIIQMPAFFLFPKDCTSWQLRDKCPYSELFWSAVSRIWTGDRTIRSIFPYSVWKRESTDQNNSQYGHFLRSGHLARKSLRKKTFQIY